MAKTLGRGLSALFGEDGMNDLTAPPVRDVKPRGGFRSLPIGKVEPNPAQPRKAFEESALEELEASIRAHGVLSPITVRLAENGYYQIIAGERRWRAARRAGLDNIPAMIVEADDKTVMEIALIENLQREDLNPIEEAEGYRALIQEFGLTQDVVAERVGRSRSAIANCMRLLGLSDDIRAMVAEGKLSSGHARAILSVQDEGKRMMAAETMMETGMSVRQAEAFAKKLNKPSPDTAEQEVKQAAQEIEVDYLADIEKRLEGALGRRVKIQSKKNKGKIELEYYGNDDLDRLVTALAAGIL